MFVLVSTRSSSMKKEIIQKQTFTTSDNTESARGRIPLTPTYLGGEFGRGVKIPPDSSSPTIPCKLYNKAFLGPQINQARKLRVTNCKKLSCMVKYQLLRINISCSHPSSQTMKSLY